MTRCLKSLYHPVSSICRRVLRGLAHPGALLCAAFLLAPASQVLADVAGVTATVTPNTVALGQTATVVVNWTMDSDGTGAGSMVTVSSTGGSFTSPAPLGSNTRLLAKIITIPGTGTAVVKFTEVLQIPASIIYTAHRQGASSFLYSRFFTDSVSGDTGSVTINIGGTSSGFLNLSRVSLTFDTEEIVRVAARDEQLKAIARINYNGAGLFDAVWEVANPASTRGEPVFIPLRIMRQYLGSGRNAILQSPPLPTEQTGLHLVRLRINTPAVAFELPVLQYQVIPGAKGGAASELSAILLTSPLPFTLYKSGTEFQWKAVEGATAYQLEIHDADVNPLYDVPARSLEKTGTYSKSHPPQTMPVTGILLPANKTAVKLSAMSQLYLQRDHRYLWRVIAISAEGAVIAASGMQEISTP